MATFDLHQRFEIRQEIGVLIDRARAADTPIKVTIEADRLGKSYPEVGLSRDQIVMSIIDVARIADVVVEFSTAGAAT
jgi:hypothetical protein